MNDNLEELDRFFIRQSLKRVTAENFELPICPKCNDTKYVKEVKVIKMICYKTYRCTVCDLEWNSRKY